MYLTGQHLPEVVRLQSEQLMDLVGALKGPSEEPFEVTVRTVRPLLNWPTALRASLWQWAEAVEGLRGEPGRCRTAGGGGAWQVAPHHHHRRGGAGGRGGLTPRLGP